MLTTRGLLFLLTTIAVVALAMLLPLTGRLPWYGHPALALVGLTLLFWFAAEWLLFAFRVRTALPRLAVEREVFDERGLVANLWAGRTFDVRLRMRLESWHGLPYVLLTDHVPFAVEQAEGDNRWEGAISIAQPAQLTYRIRCLSPGQVRFEGVTVQLSDLQGFFYHRTFVPAERVYRVLPMLTDVETRLPVLKRFNLLPPPGTHRHRRPGTGSELLDLRDYLPGDPPRMIAWKVSARRDRLITKELESDVPIRCTLFLDTSNSVRLGPPGQNALARLVEIAAAVAQACAGNRDPVGLALCDETAVKYLRPARTRRQLTEVLNLLADAAALKPATADAPADELLPLAFALAQEVCPESLRPEVNAFPSWLAWLWPRSIWTMARPRLTDYLYWAMPFVAGAVGVFVVYVFVWLWLVLAFWLAARPTADRWLVAAVLATTGLAMLLISVRVLLYLFPAKRRAYRWRKQLAALLSVRYGLAPGGLATLLEDDRQFAVYAQRFLAEHHVPTPLPLYDEQGRYLFASPGKVDVLADALLRAVGKGHDNELFVLLADLLELTDNLGPLLRAVKVTLARHHQVLVICPWPGGIPPPKKQEPRAVGGRSGVLPPVSVVMKEATIQRFHTAFYTLRRTLARLGVPVICALDEDPARLIVDRIDQLRTVRSTPRK